MIRFTTHTACILIILLLPWASIASTNDDWKLAGTIVSSIQSPNVDWHPNRSTHLRRNGSTLNRHFRPQTGGLFLAFFSSSSLIFVLT